MSFEGLVYDANNVPNIRETRDFLSEVLPLMDWSDPPSQVVMDMGCGHGYTTLNLLLSGFPEIKSLIGVDINSDLIEFARKHSAHPKITHEIADIENWDELKKWEGGIMKIFSSFCLHWIRKQDEVFKSMFRLLRPGGEAALYSAISLPFFDDAQRIGDISKWSKCYKEFGIFTPESQIKRYDAKHYKSLFEDIGFTVAMCEEKEAYFTFGEETSAREFYPIICSLTKHIPEHLREDFKDDLLRVTDATCINGKFLKVLIRTVTKLLKITEVTGRLPYPINMRSFKFW